jgi:hypothetical protein
MVKFWLMSMGLWWVIHPTIPFTYEQDRTFNTASDSALGCILTLLADTLYDLYMECTNPTELWDALERKFVVSEAGRLLYTCEQFYDFSIVAVKSIVAQAHELQLLARAITSLGCALPDRFVAVGIIAKLPATWRDFASTLKHKREDISMEDLVIALDVEEKARMKDAPSTSTAAKNGASANIIEKKFYNKNKDKVQNSGKPKKITNFKKKSEKDDKVRACYVCGKERHLAKNCRYRKDRDDGKPNKKVNVTLGDSDEAGGSRYGNFPVLFLVFQSTDWWVVTGANIHVCSDMSLFTSYQG